MAKNTRIKDLTQTIPTKESLIPFDGLSGTKTNTVETIVKTGLEATIDTSKNLDVRNTKVINVANPVNNNDAVNLTTLNTAKTDLTNTFNTNLNTAKTDLNTKISTLDTNLNKSINAVKDTIIPNIKDYSNFEFSLVRQDYPDSGGGYGWTSYTLLINGIPQGVKTAQNTPKTAANTKSIYYEVVLPWPGLGNITIQHSPLGFDAKETTLNKIDILNGQNEGRVVYYKEGRGRGFASTMWIKLDKGIIDNLSKYNLK